MEIIFAIKFIQNITIKANISFRTWKKSFLKFWRRQLFDFTPYIYNSTSYWQSTPKPQKPVQMKSSDFSIVSLKVKVIWLVRPCFLKCKLKVRWVRWVRWVKWVRWVRKLRQIKLVRGVRQVGKTSKTSETNETNEIYETNERSETSETSKTSNCNTV
jgi:hypothetical protein